ncbi:MAG: hypothetical protein RBS39_05150 [Phycisphaerales bacterium]|jgi:hypothetical protein|nr:hypothetical protein [Phycisphaerales bacterium]
MQIIAWVAAHQLDPPMAVIRAPQSRMADKGFDGLMISLDDKRQLRGIIVCEEKATENPRDTVREEVWPEVRKLEAGERDGELFSEVTTLLYKLKATDPAFDIDGALAAIDWSRHRVYRVSVTIETSRDNVKGHAALFKGYDNVAPGCIDRRHGETVCLAPLREWMDGFCGLVLDQLSTLESAAHV